MKSSQSFALAPLKEICSQGKCVSISEGRCRFEAGSILLIDYSHPSFQVFLTNQEREEGLRKLVAPCSPALLPDYLKQAQTQSEPLKPFFKPPPCKLVCSVLLLSDPHPSILCSSAFSFSASSLTWWLYSLPVLYSLFCPWPQCPTASCPATLGQSLPHTQPQVPEVQMSRAPPPTHCPCHCLLAGRRAVLSTSVGHFHRGDLKIIHSPPPCTDN